MLTFSLTEGNSFERDGVLSSRDNKLNLIRGKTNLFITLEFNHLTVSPFWTFNL